MPTDPLNIFKNKKNCMRAPYVVYADFETINVSVGDGTDVDLQSCGFCYIIVRSDGKSRDPVLYRGKDAADVFINRLLGELKWIHKSFRKKKKKSS